MNTISKLVLTGSLCCFASGLAFAENANVTDNIPYEWAPWKDPNDESKLNLAEDKDVLFQRRNLSEDPKNAPGLYYPNRYEFGPMWSSIPTFLGAPLARTPEDLKAGNVDVASSG